MNPNKEWGGAWIVVRDGSPMSLSCKKNFLRLSRRAVSFFHYECEAKEAVKKTLRLAKKNKVDFGRKEDYALLWANQKFVNGKAFFWLITEDGIPLKRFDIRLHQGGVKKLILGKSQSGEATLFWKKREAQSHIRRMLDFADEIGVYWGTKERFRIVKVEAKEVKDEV